MESKSDCNILPYIYNEMSMYDFCNKLSGKFGIILYDANADKFYGVRDHVGICPVYIGRGYDGEVYIGSELKAFHDLVYSIEILLPGHYYDSSLDKQVKWYNPQYHDFNIIPTEPVDLSKIRDLLIQSVERRLMVEVPFGVLLSGGLDSSLTASIACRLYPEYKKKHNLDYLPEKLHSFCIGLKGSPDLIASQKVADLLGTIHHPFEFTIQEGLDAISDVIYMIETFNPTTIRASTPMYLLLRKIKSLGIKVVITGEGSDEIFGGYLYFHKAPNGKELHHETIRKIQNLYMYDLLRGNKVSMGWGVEARLPFLDKDFVEYCMSINPDSKMVTKDQHMEKYILRKAFDTKEDPYLPDEILWRQKEQFSDGVGYGWVDGIKVNILYNSRILLKAKFLTKSWKMQK